MELGDQNDGSESRESDSAAIAEARRLAEQYADISDGATRLRLTIPGYDFVREIRAGGQGVVYLAVQRGTKRRVAIKVMRETRFVGVSDQQRFKREVRALGQLNHPNIVAIHDAGEVDGHSYYVMDYVPGRLLDEHVRERGPSVRDALHLFAKIVDGVAAAHQKGFIHRDLKPANILVDEQSQEPKILDFGLVKLIGDSSTGALAASVGDIPTETGQFLGSLMWSSPEQAEGSSSRVDVRTDVYALGLILYHTLTGEFPYPVVGPTREVMDHIGQTEPIPPSQVQRQVNNDLDTIILKCLAKEPERRYESAAALGVDIRRYLAGEPIEAKRDSAWYVLTRRFNRYRRVAAVSLGVLVIVIGLAVYATLQARANERLARQQMQLKEDQRRIAYRRSVSLAEKLLDANELRRAKQLLAECPTDLRNWEWYWLRGQSDQSVRELRNGRDHEFSSVVIDPMGQHVLAGSLDGSISVWDLASGGLLHVLEGPPRHVYALVAGPNGKIVSGHENGEVHVWSITTGEDMIHWQAGDRPVNALALCSGGRTLATQAPKAALWDLETGAKLRDLDAEAQTSAAARGDLLLFNTTCDELWVKDQLGGLRCVSPGDHGGDAVPRPSKEAVRGLFAHGSSPLAVVERDGHTLAWGDVASPSFVVSQGGHGDHVNGAALSPDGQLIGTASNDKTVKVWNVATGACLATLRGHDMPVARLVFSPDGRFIISAGEDFTIRFWEVTSVTVQTGFEVGDSSTAFALSADGALIVVGDRNGSVRVLERSSGQLVETLTSPTDSHLTMRDAGDSGVGSTVRYLAISPDNLWLATGHRDQSVTLWNLRDNAFRWAKRLPGYGKKVPDKWRADNQHRVPVAFSPDSQTLAVAGEDGAIYVWSVPDGGAVREPLEGHSGPIRALAFDAGGKRLFSGSLDGTVRVWDFKSQLSDPCLAILKHGSMVLSIAFHPEPRPFGRIVSAGGGYFAPIRIWDVASQACTQELHGHERDVYDVAFSHDGSRIVAAGCDPYIRLWDAESGDQLVNLQLPGVAERGCCSGMASSQEPVQDASILVLDGGGRIHVFKPSTRK